MDYVLLSLIVLFFGCLLKSIHHKLRYFGKHSDMATISKFMLNFQTYIFLKNGFNNNSGEDKMYDMIKSNVYLKFSYLSITACFLILFIYSVFAEIPS